MNTLTRPAVKAAMYDDPDLMAAFDAVALKSKRRAIPVPRTREDWRDLMKSPLGPHLGRMRDILGPAVGNVDIRDRPEIVVSLKRAQAISSTWCALDRGRLWFDRCDMRYARIENSNDLNVECLDCDLRGGMFSDLRNGRLDFDACNLSGAFFDSLYVPAPLASFARSDLTGASFHGCTFHQGDFRQSDLTLTRFTDCDLTRSTFRFADIGRASFTRCDLRGVAFSPSDYPLTFEGCSRNESDSPLDGYTVRDGMLVPEKDLR